jgi:hypothetical protein
MMDCPIGMDKLTDAHKHCSAGYCDVCKEHHQKMLREAAARLLAMNPEQREDFREEIGKKFNLSKLMTFNPIIPEARALSETQCQHPGMPLPKFDAEAARKMSSREVVKRYPRGYYVCSICMSGIIAYASMEHYIAGDW